MALDSSKWFTEICAESGSAFSLELGPEGHLHHEESEYQTIDVYGTTWFGRVMVIDGFLMLSERDNFLYHEMLAHPVLFSHPDPKRVLIVGGGDCGTLREVLKHACVEQVTQVDIDERVTRVAEEYFPALCEANEDPRARLEFADAIDWVRETEAGALDVIIVDSTDPIGPGEGLFGEAFYRDCHRALATGGLLVQQSESPLAHMDSILRPMREAMQAAGFAAPAVLHFPQPVYPTGWWTATLAGRDAGPGLARAADAEAPGFDTEYYTAAVHRAALTQPAFVRRALGIDD
ncbi:MAG: polyamine aminopropyltransferase [Halofilum sp. (in: g-proteobacteria)]|nr:polyamine aminopropyltransferase [Halofilum sp. (in: g-proteobacteria)]